MSRTKEQNRANSMRHRDKIRDFYLRKKFGITLDEYKEMFRSQQGKCAICRQTETATNKGTVKGLAVDHCHNTGRVRGLLCQNCNIALGLLKDNIAFLDKAKDYILNS